MPKLTKAGALALMDEWEYVQNKIAKAEVARNKAMAPLIERHNEELKPIVEKHDKKIAQLNDDAAVLEFQVTEFLAAANKDQILEHNGSVAEQRTETKIGGRVIDPQKFIAKAKTKGEAMWSCITVGVAKAVALIGEEDVDTIADKKETTSVSRTLRLK